MGNCAHSTLCFGVLLAEGPQPWDPDGRDPSGFRDWLSLIEGYQNPHEYPFAKAGGYKPGFSTHSENTQAYCDYLKAWERDHPPAYQLCRSGTADTCQRVLALANSVLETDWDQPLVLPRHFSPRDWRGNILEAFCRAHGIHCVGPAAWYLLAYYG